MTTVADRFAIRVMVTDAWDQVFLAVGPETTIADVKRQALVRALRRAPLPADQYIVKFRGALVEDEETTLAKLGAGANAPFIVLPGRRHPVR